MTLALNISTTKARQLALGILLFSSASCWEQEQVLTEPDYQPHILERGKQLPAKGKKVSIDSMVPPIVKPARGETMPPSQTQQYVSLISAQKKTGRPSYFPANIYPLQATIKPIKNSDATLGPSILGVWPQWHAAQLALKHTSTSHFRYLDIEQGLTGNSVKAMLEDREGKIWIATNTGISIWDGAGMMHFTQSEGLRDDYIQDLLEDKKGRIWIATRRGIDIWDGNGFHHLGRENGLSDAGINDLLEDVHGNIWIGTDDGLYIWNSTVLSQYVFSEERTIRKITALEEGNDGKIWVATDIGLLMCDQGNFMELQTQQTLKHRNIQEIAQDNAGNIWLATGKGGVSILPLSSLSSDSIGFHHYSPDKIQVTKDRLRNPNAVNTLEMGRDGKVWIGTIGDGVKVWEGAFQAPSGTNFEAFNSSNGLSHNVVYCFLEDRIGNIWIGTEAGVSIWEADSFQHFTPNKDYSNSDITYFFEDHQGKIWSGIYEGGLASWDEKGFSLFTTKQGLLSDRVISLLEDRNKNMWVGTNLGLSVWDGQAFTNYTPKNGLSGNNVDEIIQTHDGKVWIATHDGISIWDGTYFTHLTTDQGLIHNRVHSLIEDHDGNVWIGTSGGLSIWDGQSFVNFTTEEGLPGNNVWKMTQDRKGNIWLGLSDHGLCVWERNGPNIQEGQFHHFSTDEGLINNEVLSLLNSTGDIVWIGTMKGLHSIRDWQPQGPLNMQTFLHQDGLKSIRIQHMLQDQKGRLWLGSTKGIDRIKSQLTEPDTLRPQLAIREIQVLFDRTDWRQVKRAIKQGEKPVIGEQELPLKKVQFDSVIAFSNLPYQAVFPYNINHLTLSWYGIHPPTQQQIQFSHFLEGKDKFWSPLLKDNQIDYQDLRPGNYRFKVRAVGGNGRWSETVHYDFTINPPWWLTNWAKFTYLLLLISGILTYVRWRTAQLRRREKDLKNEVAIATRNLQGKNEELDRQKDLIWEAKEKAEQSERIKEQFLANMSHEIRTPMHAISGMLNIIRRNRQSTEEQLPFLEAMQTSADNLLVILNDILDLSKIEAGKLYIEEIPMDPVQVAKQVVEMLRYRAEGKGLTLQLSVTEDFPEQVLGDPTRLNQILTNLVGNAIKFSEKGKISLQLISDDNYLTFVISDTGIGIPKEQQENIFNSFTQGDDKTTRIYGGTGLGLSITQQLVHLQKGTISVESTLGQGSTFTVRLPLQTTEGISSIAKATSEKVLKTLGSELSGLRILLVDDDPFNLMISVDDLSWYIPEVQVEAVESGQVAIKRFQEKKFDLILMDVQMPGISGYEATARIRALEMETDDDQRIPILAMTASLLESEIKQCYLAGMNNYIPKPYKPEQLINTLYEAVRVIPKDS